MNARTCEPFLLNVIKLVIALVALYVSQPQSGLFRYNNDVSLRSDTLEIEKCVPVFVQQLGRTFVQSSIHE